MPINFGYHLEYVLEERTPMILMLHAHSSHVHALIRPDDVRMDPLLDAEIYHDAFGNTCTRVDAPAGALQIYADGWIDDVLLDNDVHPFAKEHPLSLLPDDVLGYLRSSRFCDVASVRDDAVYWFGSTSPGWNRVQAISQFVRRFQEAENDVTGMHRPSWRPGSAAAVASREVLHLAITLCRALNIPARYCSGYTIAATAALPALTDFSAWFEAYLGGSWQAFDPWQGATSMPRIAIAHGRDSGDVAVCTTFGASVLKKADVWAHSGVPPAYRRAMPSADNFLNERFGEPALHSPM